MINPEEKLLERITTNPEIFAGKPIIRGKRLAVEHVLCKMAAGDSAADLLIAFPFLEPDDIRACLLLAYKAVANETVGPFRVSAVA